MVDILVCVGAVYVGTASPLLIYSIPYILGGFFDDNCGDPIINQSRYMMFLRRNINLCKDE